MEIKAQIDKPFSEEEKINFIIEQNHNNGFEIEETETSLLAWGMTDEEKKEEEMNAVNNLTMTPLDFIKILQSFGLTLEQINIFLENNLNIKMQLTYCSNVFCGVVKSFLPITLDGIEITSDMIEEAFKAKKGVENGIYS